MGEDLQKRHKKMSASGDLRKQHKTKSESVDLQKQHETKSASEDLQKQHKAKSVSVDLQKKNKRMSVGEFFVRLSFVFGCFFVIVNGYLLIKIAICKDYVVFGKFLAYTTASSFEPKINKDSFFLCDENVDEISEGDIIVFDRGNGWELSEVYSVTGSGENEEVEVHKNATTRIGVLISSSAIIGKYSKNLAIMTGIFNFINSTWGFLTFIVFPVLFYVLFELCVKRYNYLYYYNKAVLEKNTGKERIKQVINLYRWLDKLEAKGVGSTAKIKNDMDTNNDDFVSVEELQKYLDKYRKLEKKKD